MDLEAAKYAFNYCVDESIPFQLTGNSYGSFTIDFQYNCDIHARILHKELRENGFDVGFDYTLSVFRIV